MQTIDLMDYAGTKVKALRKENRILRYYSYILISVIFVLGLVLIICVYKHHKIEQPS